MEHKCVQSCQHHYHLQCHQDLFTLYTMSRTQVHNDGMELFYDMLDCFAWVYKYKHFFFSSEAVGLKHCFILATQS